jgi:hypothetical protein
LANFDAERQSARDAVHGAQIAFVATWPTQEKKMFFLVAGLLWTMGRAQSSNCTAANATLSGRVQVVATATLTLSVNVSGFGVTRVTESGSDDDVAMEFSNLTLVVPLKSDPLSSTRLPGDTAQASVSLAASAVCDLREWATAGRVQTPAAVRVLVNRTTVDLRSALLPSVLERIPFATWRGPLLALRVTAFERDASQNNCRFFAGDDDLANVTFTNQLCAVESTVCASTIGASMDGWQAAGLFEFRLAPSWTLGGARRRLLVTASGFADVPPLPSVAATRTVSAPYEFVDINITAGGLRFSLDADANLVRHLHSDTLTVTSAGSAVQLVFAAPFNASRNADRRVAEGIYNVSLAPLMRARQVQLVDCLQPALELVGAGAEWPLLAYGFSQTPNQVSLWFTIGTLVTTTTTLGPTTTTTLTTVSPTTTVSANASISPTTTSSTIPTTTQLTTTAVTTSPLAPATTQTSTAPATTPTSTAAITSTTTTLTISTAQASSDSTVAATTSSTAPQSFVSPLDTSSPGTVSTAQASASLQTAIEASDSAAIIGGAVGGGVGLMAVVGIVFAAVWYRRRASPPVASNDTAMQVQQQGTGAPARNEYGPVLVRSQYGPAPAESVSSHYAATAVDFKVGSETSVYGEFKEIVV